MTTHPEKESGVIHPRIVIADRQASLRDLLKRVVEHNQGWRVVGETASGVQALHLCRLLAPDILILELSLNDLNGPEVLAELRLDKAPTRSVIFTSSKNELQILAALRCRPNGFVHKEDSLFSLQAALSAVLRGRSYLCSVATNLHEQAASDGLGAQLGVRERAVLRMVAEGLPSKAIATALGISVKTVDHERADLIKKLGYRDVAGLVRIALRMGLIT